MHFCSCSHSYACGGFDETSSNHLAIYFLGGINMPTIDKIDELLNKHADKFDGAVIEVAEG